MILPLLKKHCKVLSAVAGESSARAGPARSSHAAAHTTAATQWHREAGERKLQQFCYAKTPLIKCHASWS